MSGKVYPLCTLECTTWIMLWDRYIVIFVEVFRYAIMCVSVQMKYLVWVSIEVKVFQEASGKFTEQEVVCVIDGPEAPVCVVVGTGARTEWTH